MKTSIRCCEYDDILSKKDIYSMLAVAALRNGFFGVCSKSFVQVLIHLSFCFPQIHINVSLIMILILVGDASRLPLGRERGVRDFGGKKLLLPLTSFAV